jgi:hypothetical protein
MPTPGSNHMHGHASVKQERFMRAPEIVQAQVRKSQSISHAAEPVGYILRAPQFGERERLAVCRGQGNRLPRSVFGPLICSPCSSVSSTARSHERIGRQLNERQIDGRTVRDACNNSQVLLALG